MLLNSPTVQRWVLFGKKVHLEDVSMCTYMHVTPQALCHTHVGPFKERVWKFLLLRLDTQLRSPSLQVNWGHWPVQAQTGSFAISKDGMTIWRRSTHVPTTVTHRRRPRNHSDCEKADVPLSVSMSKRLDGVTESPRVRWGQVKHKRLR